LTIGADGKVYGSLTPSGKVFIYDPTTGNIIYLGIPLPNNTIRGLTTSQDGKIYGGTMPDGHLISYDPQTGNFNDFGQVVATPGIWSITTGNNGRIYIGGANGNFVSYDPRMAWNPGTTPENNPRDYGVAVSGEDRIRCLTVGTDNLIYGGTAHHAHLFVFVPKPIFVAHFMTPEREPWPFDVIISNGVWRKEFTNIIDLITETLEQATYNFLYEREGKKSTFFRTEPFVFSPGAIHTYEFYALAPSEITDINRPYLLWQEEGANAVLTWETQNGFLTKFVCAKEHGKQAGYGVPLDDSPNELPNRIIVFQAPEVCCAEGHFCCWPWHHYYCHCDFCPVYQVWACLDTGGPVRIGYSFYNDNILAYPLNTLLRDIAGNLYTRKYFDPQFVVKEGNYILSMDGTPEGYLNFTLPLRVREGVWLCLSKIYTPKIENLTPFTFGIAAEDFFDYSGYSNLMLNGFEISVNVTTQARYDWWGYFVLPETLTVKDLITYSDTTLLGLNYDFAVSHIANYNIVVVRINKDVEKLRLTYGQIAAVDIVPDVLNIESQGRWITGYIELPSEYDVNDIDMQTVELRYGSDGNVKAELHPTQVGDYDKDGIPDRMVKFSREAVISLLSIVEPPFDAELQVVGNLLDGTPFASTDIVHVIAGPGGPQITSTSPAGIPKVFSFSPAIPNPFRKVTSLKFGLPKDCNVTLQIYDVTGRLVRQLLDSHQSAGFVSVCWDGKDDTNANLGSGVYFVRIQADEFIATQRVILIK
ncbi:MAG: FlgD immunoglobulin-like domain containing protein, partial [candidate division WOR-3 bacterium]